MEALGGAIPSNVILNKTICGCGATYSEIKAPRNSIIIEPNVPVIRGKEKDHPEVMGVYEGRNKKHVIKYLREAKGYKKLITTPESFLKIKKAMLEMGIDMYEDYFLLFDECERIIQDVGYRGSIALPMDEFFKFRNKAMVSATPLMPSDPRFVQQNFKILKLTPDYDYKQEIELVTTNNIVAVLRTQFALWSGEKPLFIFLNSTDTIHNIICTFELQNRSKVFCSDKSVRKLRDDLGYPEAYSEITDFAEFNFFTSRFFSAVDIRLDYQPNVIIISDVFRAKQSMLDPKTEITQILGRFRNGVGKRVHIANHDSRIKWLSKKNMREYLESCEKFYETVDDIQVNTCGQGAIKSKKQAKEGMDYHNFVKKDGTRNYFMWDNAHDDERIKSYYYDVGHLLAAYKNSPLIAIHREMNSPLGDEDRLRRTKPKMSFHDLCKELVRELNILQKNLSDVEYPYLMNEVKQCCEFIVDAYFILGAEKLVELDFNKSKIKKALGKYEYNVRFEDEKILNAVYSRFNVDDVVAVSEVTEFFKRLVKDFAIPYEGAYNSSLMKRYFEFTESRTSSERRIKLTKRLL